MNLTKEEIQEIIKKDAENEKIFPVNFLNESEVLKESSYLFYEFKDIKETHTFSTVSEYQANIETYTKEISPLFANEVINDKSNWQLLNIITEEIPFYHLAPSVEETLEDNLISSTRDIAELNVPAPMQEGTFYPTYFRDAQGTIYNNLILNIFNKLRWSFINENQYLNADLFIELADKTYTEEKESLIKFNLSDENVKYLDNIVNEKLLSTYAILDYIPMQTDLLYKWIESEYMGGKLDYANSLIQKSVYKLQDVKHELLRRKFAGSSTLYKLVLSSINRQGSFIGTMSAGDLTKISNFKDKRYVRNVYINGITANYTDLTNEIDPINVFNTKPLLDESCTSKESYNTFKDFPATGVERVLYCDLETENEYVWYDNEYRLKSDANYIPLNTINSLFFTSAQNVKYNRSGDLSDYNANKFYLGYDDISKTFISSNNYKNYRYRDNNSIIEWNELQGISNPDSSIKTYNTLDQLIEDSNCPSDEDKDFYEKHNISKGYRLRTLDDTYINEDTEEESNLSLDISYPKINSKFINGNILDISCNKLLYHSNSLQQLQKINYPYLRYSIADENSVSLMDSTWLDYIKNTTEKKSRVQDNVLYGSQVNKYVEFDSTQNAEYIFFGISYSNKDCTNTEDKELYKTIKDISNPKYAYLWYCTIKYDVESFIVTKFTKKLISKITLKTNDSYTDKDPDALIELTKYNVGILPFTYKNINKDTHTDSDESLIYMRLGKYDGDFYDDLSDLNYAKAYYVFSTYDILTEGDYNHSNPSQYIDRNGVMSLYPNKNTKSVFYVVKHNEEYSWSTQIKVMPLTLDLISDIEKSTFKPEWYGMGFNLNPYLNFTTNSATPIRHKTVYKSAIVDETKRDINNPQYRLYTESVATTEGASTITALCNLNRNRMYDVTCNDDGNLDYPMTWTQNLDDGHLSKKMNGFYLERVHNQFEFNSENKLVNFDRNYSEYVSIYGDNRTDDIFNYIKGSIEEQDRTNICYDSITENGTTYTSIPCIKFVANTVDTSKNIAKNYFELSPCKSSYLNEKESFLNVVYTYDFSYARIEEYNKFITIDYNNIFKPQVTCSVGDVVLINLSHNDKDNNKIYEVLYHVVEDVTDDTITTNFTGYKLTLNKKDFENYPQSTAITYHNVELSEDLKLDSIIDLSNFDATEKTLSDNYYYNDNITKGSYIRFASSYGYLAFDEYYFDAIVTKFDKGTISYYPLNRLVKCNYKDSIRYKAYCNWWWVNQKYDGITALFNLKFSEFDNPVTLISRTARNSIEFIFSVNRYGTNRQNVSLQLITHNNSFAIDGFNYEDFANKQVRLGFSVSTEEAHIIVNNDIRTKKGSFSFPAGMYTCYNNIELFGEKGYTNDYKFVQKNNFYGSVYGFELYHTYFSKEQLLFMVNGLTRELFSYSPSSYILGYNIYNDNGIFKQINNNTYTDEFNEITSIRYFNRSVWDSILIDNYPVSKEEKDSSSYRYLKDYEDTKSDTDIWKSYNSEYRLNDCVQQTLESDIEVLNNVHSVSDKKHTCQLNYNNETIDIKDTDINTIILNTLYPVSYNNYSFTSDYGSFEVVDDVIKSIDDTKISLPDSVYSCDGNIGYSADVGLNFKLTTDVDFSKAYSYGSNIAIKYSNDLESSTIVHKDSSNRNATENYSLIPLIIPAQKKGDIYLDKLYLSGVELDSNIKNFLRATHYYNELRIPMAYNVDNHIQYGYKWHALRYLKEGTYYFTCKYPLQILPYYDKDCTLNNYNYLYGSVRFKVQVKGVQKDYNSETYDTLNETDLSKYYAENISSINNVNVCNEYLYDKETTHDFDNCSFPHREIYIDLYVQDCDDVAGLMIEKSDGSITENYNFNWKLIASNHNTDNVLELTPENLDKPLIINNYIPLFFEKSYNTPFFIPMSEKTRVDGEITTKYNSKSADDDLIDPIKINTVYGSTEFEVFNKLSNNDKLYTSETYYSDKFSTKQISNDIISKYNTVGDLITDEEDIYNVYSKTKKEENLTVNSESDMDNLLLMGGRSYKLLFNYTGKISEISYTKNIYDSNVIKENGEEKINFSRLTDILNDNNTYIDEYIYTKSGYEYNTLHSNIIAKTSGYDIKNNAWTSVTNETDTGTEFDFGNPYSRCSINNYILSNVNSERNRTNITNSRYFAYKPTNLPSNVILGGYPFLSTNRMRVVNGYSKSITSYYLDEKSVINNIYNNVYNSIITSLSNLKSNSSNGLFSRLSKIYPSIQSSDKGMDINNECNINSGNMDLLEYTSNNVKIPLFNKFNITRKGLYSNNLLLTVNFDDNRYWHIKDCYNNDYCKDNQITHYFYSDEDWDKDVYKIEYIGESNEDNPLLFDYTNGNSSINSHYEIAISFKSTKVQGLKIYGVALTNQKIEFNYDEEAGIYPNVLQLTECYDRNGNKVDIKNLQNDTWYTISIDTSTQSDDTIESTHCGYIFMFDSMQTLCITKPVVRASSYYPTHKLGLTTENTDLTQLSLDMYKNVIFRDSNNEVYPIMFKNSVLTTSNGKINIPAFTTQETFVNNYFDKQLDDYGYLKSLHNPFVQRLEYKRKATYSNDSVSYSESANFHEYNWIDNKQSENVAMNNKLFKDIEMRYVENSTSDCGFVIDKLTLTNGFNGAISQFNVDLTVNDKDPIYLSNEKFTLLENALNPSSYNSKEDLISITNIQLLSKNAEDKDVVMYELEYLPIIYDEKKYHISSNIFLHKNID